MSHPASGEVGVAPGNPEVGELEELFRTAPFLLVRIGFDGFLKRVNPAWGALGWSEEELLGRPWFSFLIHPSDLEATKQAVAAMGSGTAVIEFEMRLMCKDGSWRWFSCSGRPRMEEGVFYGIGIDITERKRAEDEVRQINEELRARTRQLEDAERRLRDSVRELTTPVLEVRPGLVVVPVIGALDSERVREVADNLLKSIHRRRIRAVILDITGVPGVDSTVANHLIKTVEAVRLMGCETIVTGLSADVALALVGLGVDMRSLRTLADLRSGIEEGDRLLASRGGQ